MSDKVLVRTIAEKYNSGDIICREGDEGHDMYIIKSGKVEVLREMGDDAMVLATLGPKEFFGEMALFGVCKRTATVRAVEPSEVIVVTKKMLETQYRKVPEWLVSMIKTIASRIITTAKGVKLPFKISTQYSVLKSIMLICERMGTPTEKGYYIPTEVLRDELMYTLGLSYDEIDVWLKRFNLVNLVKVIGGKGMAEIPDFKRFSQYIDYLYSLSPEGKKAQLELSSDSIKSFERIQRLLQRK